MEDIIDTTTPVLPTKIALCLSGGGLRATYFHLGTIKALRRLGLLDKVTNIVSVSGGSILAAHLVLNWNKYCGSDADFKEIEQKIRDFAARDLRGRVIRRWILTGITLILPRSWKKFRYGPIEHLEREYRRLFHSKSFDDLVLEQPNAPNLQILSTNLTSGELCSFNRDGYYSERNDDPLLAHQTIPFSLAVTASSAFPPVFPPVAIERQMFAVEIARFPVSPHLLTDGGVFDNLGFEKALLMEGRGDLDVDLIFVSDAGGPFDWSISSTFFWPVARSIRAADILMNRISEGTLKKAIGNTLKRAIIHSSIKDATKHGPAQNIQSRLRYIRTDLDRFNTTEIDYLEDHGERVAINKIEEKYKLPSSAAQYAVMSSPPSTEKLEKILDKSAQRDWGIFNLRDWTFYALTGIAALIVSGVYVAVVTPRFALQRADSSIEENAAAARQLSNKVETLQQKNETLARGLTVAQETLAKLEPTGPSSSTPPQKSDWLKPPRTFDFDTKWIGGGAIMVPKSLPSTGTTATIPVVKTPVAAPIACRDPSHGIERFDNQSTPLTRESGWMGGGHSQPEWCNQLISNLQPSNPGAVINIVTSGESSRSSCTPFNCPQYNYTCTVQVAKPIYYEKVSAACTTP